MDTWRSWDLVLPALERRHDVLALTLPGHAGAPSLAATGTVEVVDAVERAIDAAGFGLVDLAGNSLGGHVALQLAARGRARNVVALAPAGGWAREDESWRELFALQRGVLEQARAAAPHADAIMASPGARRRATRLLTERFEHIPAELLAHQLRAVAASAQALAMLERAAPDAYRLDAERIACPVRIVWGTKDRLLPWPSAAHRFRAEWLPHADWVELEGVGHCPQLDVPLETAQLILGFTAER